MIPTIGLVVFGYVFVRMLELALDAQARSIVRQCAGLLMVGAVVDAVLLLMQSRETTRALDGTPEDEYPTFSVDTTAVVPYGIDTISPPLVIPATEP